MAQLLTLRPPVAAVRSSSSTRSDSAASSRCRKTLNPKWASLQQELKCNGRFSCLFSGNRKQVNMFSSFFSFPLHSYFVGFLTAGILLGTHFSLLHGGDFRASFGLLAIREVSIEPFMPIHCCLKEIKYLFPSFFFQFNDQFIHFHCVEIVVLIYDSSREFHGKSRELLKETQFCFELGAQMFG